MDRAHLARGQTPVAGHTRPYRDDGRMRGIAGGEFFPRAHHDLHRTLGPLRQEVGDGQVTRVALAPEIAPDRDDVHADVLLPEPQRVRQLPTRPEWRFAGTPGVDPAVLVEGYHAGKGLQIALVTAGDGKRVLQDDLGLAKALTYIAFGPRQPCLPVVHVCRQHVERRSGVGRDIVMEQRSIRSHGFYGVEDRRQHVVVDVDE